MRYLKLPVEQGEKRALYEAVKESDLYDGELSMYKVNASLADSSFELGRARAFTPWAGSKTNPSGFIWNINIFLNFCAAVSMKNFSRISRRLRYRSRTRRLTEEVFTKIPRL